MTGPARLLLVDDDESNCDFVTRRLLRNGYHVEVAENGDNALALLRGHRYDLVLLDHMLPGISGHEVLRRIRQSWSDSEMPVIMVTAIDESRQIVEALRLGANDYITKPLDFAVALARIEKHLRLAREDRELRQTRELYRLALGTSEEGLWDWDLITGNLHWSPQWEAVFGTGENNGASSEDWLARIHPDDRAEVGARVQAHLKGRSPAMECEYRLRGKDGQYHWVESRGTLARDSQGKPARLVGCQTDITVRKTVDPLTSLANRARLEQELASIAAAGRRVALLLLELDGLDRIEENFQNGDAGHFLKAVGCRFRDCLASRPEGASSRPEGSSAFVARAGDRQFAVLLPDASGPAAAKEAATALQATLADPFDIGGQSIFATASAGIAFAYAAAPGDDLLRDATAALRHAREQGTGHRAVFQTFMRRDDLAEMHMEHDLHHALERSEFEVWYQPKVDLVEDRIAGCEALVRWNRPGHGLVSPADFIPAAERTGVVVTLGRFVLERACREIVELRRDYPWLSVSVNVSGRQFAEPDLVEQVRSCLADTRLDPAALRLEITETFLLEDPAGALHTLARLRALGVGLKLDDFGSGYSSLDYLSKFPFDTVKIDRTFVSRITTSHESAEIVRAVLGLSRSLNLTVVAEGIENRAQLDCLKELGCRYGQGYWFSPPVPLERIKEILSEWRQPAGCVEVEG